MTLCHYCKLDFASHQHDKPICDDCCKQEKLDSMLASDYQYVIINGVPIVIHPRRGMLVMN